MSNTDWIIVAAFSGNLVIMLLCLLLRPKPLRVVTQPRTITVNRYTIRNQMPAASRPLRSVKQFTVMPQTGVLHDEKDLAWKGAGHINHNDRGAA